MTMSLRKCVPVVVSSLALSLFSSIATAQDWKAVGNFGWFGVGKMQEIEKGHFYWVGEFSGTFFSDKGAGGLFHNAGVKCPAFYDVDMNAGKHTSGGYCIVADVEGDQAYLSWSNKGDGRNGTGTFTYTGGTGKYKGIKGPGGAFTTLLHAPWPDGTTSGLSNWNK